MAGKVDSINSNLSYNMYLTTLKSRGVANAGAVNPVIKSTGVDAKVDTVQFGNSTNNAQLKAELTARVNTVSADLKKAEDNNGFIGKAWSWTKNTFGFGDSSNKVKKSQSKEKELLANFDKDPKGTFEQLTGVPYTAANIERFNRGEIKLKSEQNLDGYKEGQDMCVDITGDIVSGVVALGAVAAAPFTGGASLLLAAGAGALVKTGIKYADAKSAGREYDSFARDMATGAFSGLLAPITGGAGGAIGKAVASRLGLEAVQIGVKSVAVNAASQTAKQGLKQGLKTIIANPAGYTYTGGNILKRGVAYGVEMATDGALGGAVDNAFRTAYDGGTIKPSQLPNTARHIDDVKFKGKSAGELKRAILDQTGLSEKEFEQLLEFSANYNVDILSKKLEYLGLSEKDIASVFEKDELKLLLEMDDKAEDIFKDRILPVLTGVDTYSVVTSSPSLKPFHLTLKDASEIMDAVQNRDFAKIDSILRRVNEDLYEELGGYNYLQQTLPTTKKLNENILATVIDDKNIRTLDVEINGCKKTIKVLDDEVLSPQATSRTATVKDMEKILDSNMLTTDFIQFLKNNNLEHLISNSPTDVRIKVEQWKKGSNGLEDLTFTKDVPMSFWNVVDKITTDGVIDPKKMSDLTEFEVHLLTDKISDCFKKLDLNVQNNFVQSVSAKTNGIYRYVEALADKARRNPDVKSGKVIIDDHVYMRMLDRDLVNVIDLTAIPPSMMGFNQLVDNLVEAAKKGQTKLEGLETVGGISMILENGPKGAKVIRTVMM